MRCGRPLFPRSLLSNESDSGSTKSRCASASVSLILPMTPGSDSPWSMTVAEYRRILEEDGGFESVEVIVAQRSDSAVHGARGEDHSLRGWTRRLATTLSSAEAANWPALVRAGLAAATGEHLVVLDVNRHYSPESLVRVLDPVRTGECDLAVAVPRRGRSSLASWLRSWLGSA